MTECNAEECLWNDTVSCVATQEHWWSNVEFVFQSPAYSAAIGDHKIKSNTFRRSFHPLAGPPDLPFHYFASLVCRFLDLIRQGTPKPCTLSNKDSLFQKRKSATPVVFHGIRRLGNFQDPKVSSNSRRRKVVRPRFGARPSTSRLQCDRLTDLATCLGLSATN